MFSLGQIINIKHTMAMMIVNKIKTASMGWMSIERTQPIICPHFPGVLPAQCFRRNRRYIPLMSPHKLGKESEAHDQKDGLYYIRADYGA